MNIPGFTAEKSLSETSAPYNAAAIEIDARAAGAVQPAQPHIDLSFDREALCFYSWRWEIAFCNPVTQKCYWDWRLRRICPW